VSWTVYILRTRSGRLYTGITTDIERRVRQHRSELKGGAKSIKGDPPASVAYTEAQPDRGTATKREAAIKRLPRAKKLVLIDSVGRGRRAKRA
jgi:putative endonuclease